MFSLYRVYFLAYIYVYQSTLNIIYKSSLQFQVHEIAYFTIHITHYFSSYIRLLSSAVWHQLSSFRRLLFTVDSEPEVRLHPESGYQLPPACPTSLPAASPAHQCTCLTTCIPYITCTRRFENNNLRQVIQYLLAIPSGVYTKYM